jgi:hypothetical protein
MAARMLATSAGSPQSYALTWGSTSGSARLRAVRFTGSGSHCDLPTPNVPQLCLDYARPALGKGCK